MLTSVLWYGIMVWEVRAGLIPRNTMGKDNQYSLKCVCGLGLNRMVIIFHN